jgi:hypothetical protein
METIKKYNIGYILSYIFIPAIIIAICVILNVIFDWRGSLAVITLFFIPMIAILFWCFASTLLYKQKKNQMPFILEEQGVVCNQTFYGGSCTVVVDEINKQVGLLFRWNPFQVYTIPAYKITKAWVDDGASGAGFMKGSSRVSFLFVVDGIKIRVNTFTSNKRWRMDSNYILTGISKADMMVEILNSTRGVDNSESI